MTKIGCHVTIRQGIDITPKLAHELGCEAMQIFTRSPYAGKTPELKPEVAKKFKEDCKKYEIKNVYIHAPYFINLASADNRIKYGSISAIKTELERASMLGAKYLVTHIGSTKDLGETEAIKITIESLEKALGEYKGTAKLLLENSSGAGKIIGAKFEELGKILKPLKKYKSLDGMCLDTQHSFAAGYDWKNNFENIIKSLEENIGLDNVKLIHTNDSDTDLGSNKDRHENIGMGKIGLDAFKKIKQFAVKNKIDMICETKHPGVIEDIEILKNL